MGKGRQEETLGELLPSLLGRGRVSLPRGHEWTPDELRTTRPLAEKDHYLVTRHLRAESGEHRSR